MSKSLKYVKDFDFSSAGKTVGLCKGGMAKPQYARGGPVAEKATGERYPSREAMVRHESRETPRMQREELLQRAKVVAPQMRAPGGLPARAPLIPMKTGGPVPAKGAAKIPKVMSEFKAGELHSGSKTGPAVKSRKQAVAIALSEARAAGRK